MGPMAALSMTGGCTVGQSASKPAPQSASTPGDHRKILRVRSPSGCWRCMATRVGDQHWSSQENCSTGVMQASDLTRTRQMYIFEMGSVHCGCTAAGPHLSCTYTLKSTCPDPLTGPLRG